MSNDMQNVPFGSAPIIGFASALASALSTRAHYLEVGRNYRPSVPEQRQGNSIKSLAAMVSAAGDRDASVRALGLVNVAIHGAESEYKFGARQLAVLDTIGLDEIPPGAEGVLAQLVATATVICTTIRRTRPFARRRSVTGR